MLYWPINSVKEYPNIKEMFVRLTNAYSYRKGERDAFAVLVNLINRREKMDLLEGEEFYFLCRHKTFKPKAVFSAASFFWKSCCDTGFSVSCGKAAGSL